MGKCECVVSQYALSARYVCVSMLHFACNKYYLCVLPRMWEVNTSLLLLCEKVRKLKKKSKEPEDTAVDALPIEQGEICLVCVAFWARHTTKIKYYSCHLIAFWIQRCSLMLFYYYLNMCMVIRIYATAYACAYVGYTATTTTITYT